VFKKPVVEAACDQYKGKGCEAWFAPKEVKVRIFEWTGAP
jgi:hypothetical protein